MTHQAEVKMIRGGVVRVVSVNQVPAYERDGWWQVPVATDAPGEAIPMDTNRGSER